MEQELFPEHPILVVDDEEHILKSIESYLMVKGITNIECCGDSRDVMPRLKKKKYSVILLDILMPGISGDELLPQIIESYPDIPVIIVTAFPDDEIAKNCMKKGAYECLRKPVDIKNLIKTIAEALKLKGSYEEIVTVKKELFSDTNRQQRPEKFTGIISRSAKMQSIFQTIALIALTSNPVLIRGEAGVGKELVAREIHTHSRREGKFVLFNTTDIDDTSFLEKLLGHKKGLLEVARDGTLYLTEIADLSLQAQFKLTHLIRDGEYYPLGTEEPVSHNVRIIAATNKNITALIDTGAFRKGIYSLFQNHEMNIPPLRDRREDIPLLIEHFVNIALENSMKKPQIPNELFTLLEKYDFPSNISELKKMVYRSVDRYRAGLLPLDVFIAPIEKRIVLDDYSLSPGVTDSSVKKIDFGRSTPSFAEVEEMYLDEVMKRAGGDHSKAARTAGLDIRAFTTRLKRIKRTQKREETAKILKSKISKTN